MTDIISKDNDFFKSFIKLEKNLLILQYFLCMYELKDNYVHIQKR